MPVSIRSFRLAQTANATATSFTAKTPSATKPSGTGIIDLMDTSLGLHQTGYVSRYAQLVPFGENADNETFDMQLWGWSKAILASSTLWVPQLLVEVNVVLGNIAATALGTDHFLADTITIAKGDTDAPEISPANNYVGSILVHLRGCELLEFEFDADAGASASAGANCLYRVVDQT